MIDSIKIIKADNGWIVNVNEEETFVYGDVAELFDGLLKIVKDED